MNCACIIPESPKRSFWQRRVVDVFLIQLRQGITPKKISLTLALGLTLGIFPIVGATTLLCLVFGIWLKLNQPIIQTLNYLAAAVQLLLIPLFVRIGEFIVRARPVSFSVSEMFRTFHQSPRAFFHEFGLTGIHGIIGWLSVSPGLALILYLGFLPFLERLARNQQK